MGTNPTFVLQNEQTINLVEFQEYQLAPITNDNEKPTKQIENKCRYRVDPNVQRVDQREKRK